MSRQEMEERRRYALRKQIAVLQAQLADPSAPAPADLPCTFESPKRKRPDAQVLAPASPSPKRQRRTPDAQGDHHRTLPKSAVNVPRGTVSREPNNGDTAARATPPSQPPPSNVLTKLSQLGGTAQRPAALQLIERSKAFTDRPEASVPVAEAASGAAQFATRDDRLALVEELEPGPYEHKPPFDDPLFEKLEPHSGIHLLSRAVQHEDIQEYMTGRYYISASKLYSVIRLLPNNQGYDVPVVGDWLTIAVVAQRGEIMTTRAPIALGQVEERDADDLGESSSGATAATGPHSRLPAGKNMKKNAPPPKLAGRKYVNMKLVDFGARSRASSSGGKAVIRGDAFLTLLLFEADNVDLLDRQDGGRPEKTYKGGSRGAFESMAKLREGSVIALLNPRILKPYKGTTDKPHPTTNILAITPESAASILVIGRARDLGMCMVKKRDGKVCGSWCDKRVSDVCDYHIQTAVERSRAGRAEFSVGTSGLSTAAPKRKPAYDPQRKWGLVPENKPQLSADGGSTYVVAGHVVSGSTSKSLFTSENIGREAQARAQRKKGAKDADRAVQKLLERDREGMRAVEKAREYALEMRMKARGKEGTAKKGKGKAQTGSDSDQDRAPSTAARAGHASKNAYSAEVIKRIGFDPTIKPGHQRQEDSSDVVAQLKDLASRRSANNYELGPRPGRKLGASVSAPVRSKVSHLVKVLPDGVLPELDDDDELERQEMAVFGRTLDHRPDDGDQDEGMVDLGSSDDDLVIKLPRS
ncbi:hypothetical protein FA95DRAFT_1601776 [Auriscalpium vulgare]|uniref:Uncharacterized protein n=1 Tax=Auriscalpium vulgare TaxID=40419 RepID=A0ACB8S8E9_9AGAM|nr:hypothetical protein FA95DRAFT_1601776 [Auriscalpium vulgare]